MIRCFGFSLLALMAFSTSSRGERLVLGHSAIYREATDDYEFRARFSYDVESITTPDLSISFWIYGPRPQDGLLDTLGYVADWRLHGDEPATLDRIIPLPLVKVSTPLTVIDEATVSFYVPRNEIEQLGDVEVLFPYHVRIDAVDGSRGYQFGIPNQPLVQLNVPEPSSVLLTAAAVAPLSILARRRLRNILATT
jgi:hypothetical protein